MEYSADFTEDAIRHYVSEFSFTALRREEAIKSSDYTEKDLLDFDRKLLGLCQGIANNQESCLVYAQSQWKRFEDEDLLPILFFIYSFHCDVDALASLVEQLNQAEIDYIDIINRVLTWVSEITLKKLITTEKWPTNTDIIVTTIMIKAFRAGLVDTQYLLDLYPSLTQDVAKKIMIDCFGDNKLSVAKLLLYAEYKNNDSALKIACYRALLLIDEANILPQWEAMIQHCQEDKSKPLFDLLVKRLDYDDVLILIKYLFTSLHQYDKALIIAGMSGLVKFIPWILTLIENDIEITLAVGQLELITGLDLTKENMEKEVNNHFVPDLEKIQRWWIKNENRFSQYKRYLLGKELNYKNLVNLFKSNHQLCRYNSSLYLALLSPSTPLLDLNEPSFSVYYGNITYKYQKLLSNQDRKAV